jgi:hypothetical protein
MICGVGPPRAAHLLRFRHSHGGTGTGSAHKPFFASRAYFSSPSSTVSPGAYFRYHQHQLSPSSHHCGMSREVGVQK